MPATLRPSTARRPLAALACAVALAACAGGSVATTSVASQLGRQPVVSLHVCELHEQRPAPPRVECPAGHPFAFVPLVGFAGLSFYFAFAFFSNRSGGRSASSVAVGLLAALPGVGLCYAMFSMAQRHTFAFDPAARRVVHEARFADRVWQHEEAPFEQARCTTPYSRGGKNKTSGWKVILLLRPEDRHTLGSFHAEQDARAVCAYLLPPATPTP